MNQFYVQVIGIGTGVFCGVVAAWVFRFIFKQFVCIIESILKVGFRFLRDKIELYQAKKAKSNSLAEVQ